MSAEDDVGRLATALPEVTERTSYGTPAFYVAGKNFARMHEEPGVPVCWRHDSGGPGTLLEAALNAAAARAGCGGAFEDG